MIYSIKAVSSSANYSKTTKHAVLTAEICPATAIVLSHMEFGIDFGCGLHLPKSNALSTKLLSYMSKTITIII